MGFEPFLSDRRRGAQPLLSIRRPASLPNRNETFFLRFSKGSTVFWAGMLVFIASLSREVDYVLNAAFSLRGLTSGALVNGDTFTGALSRDAGENAGTYTILQGTLAAPLYYDLTFAPGTLTIESYERATFTSTAGRDGLVLESTETSEIGGSLNAAGVLVVGDDSLDRQYRSILSFDTSSLPDNALITGVVLKVKRWQVVGTNPFVTHKPLLVDIRQGSFVNRNFIIHNRLATCHALLRSTPQRSGVGKCVAHFSILFTNLALRSARPAGWMRSAVRPSARPGFC